MLAARAVAGYARGEGWIGLVVDVGEYSHTLCTCTMCELGWVRGGPRAAQMKIMYARIGTQDNRVRSGGLGGFQNQFEPV